MAKINLTQLAIAAGVGVVDELLERQDVKSGKVVGSFNSYSGYARVGLPVIGLALQMFMPKYGHIGATVATATMPLLVKTIAKTAMPATASGRLGAGRAYPRMAPAARVGARSPEFDLIRQT